MRSFASVARAASTGAFKRRRATINPSFISSPQSCGFSTANPLPPAENEPVAAAPKSALPNHAVVGLSVAFGTSIVGFEIANVLGKGLMSLQGIETATSPVSGIPVSILLGLALRNLALSRRPETVEALKSGLALASKPVLQLGVVCVGMKLSAVDLVEAGMVGVPAVVASVGVGLLFVPWLGKQMGLPHKMSALIAAGTSICGVTAITAVAPSIKANEQESAFAVANVVAFGTAGMLVYPYVAHDLFETSRQIGMFLGLAIHDTSQVIGSALTYSNVYDDEAVLKMAAVTKLTRNLFLAGAIPYLTYTCAAEEGKNSADQEKRSVKDLLYAYTPGFVYAFVGASAFRSLGDYTVAHHDAAFMVLPPDQWTYAIGLIGTTIGAKMLLGTAMAGVGLSTNFSTLRGVGPKPFLVGFLGSSAVATTGFTMASVLA